MTTRAARTEPAADVALPSEQTTQRREPTIEEALASPAQRAEFARALPAHVGVDRFTRVALTTIRTDPKGRLKRCTTGSLLAGLMQAAQLGLEVSGVRGQAYLVPRRDGRASRATGRDVFEATFQLGFRGMIDLAARSGITVDVDIVHANDEFWFQRGTDPKLHHRPTLDDPGPPIAYYAVAHFADSRRSQFALRSVKQIEAHRDRFAAQRDQNGDVSGPWVDHFDAMALKTVVRMLLDKLPTSIELRTAVVADEAPSETVQAHVSVADPVGAIDVSSVDVETGEIAAPPDAIDTTTSDTEADTLPIGDEG